MNLAVAAAIVATAATCSAAAFLVVRRRAPRGGFFADGDRGSGLLGVLATGFSVLLGFVVYLAFTSYDTARNGARSEATDLVQQFETAQLLPPPASRALSGQLVCYGRAVIGVEWPLLRRGIRPSFNPWGLPLFETLETIAPHTPAQQAAYAKWLDETSAREEARLQRVQAGRGVIPSPLWMILIVTGALVFLCTFLFADPSEGLLPQAAIPATIAAMLATSVLIIRFLDNPYSPGTGSLQPTDMVRALKQIVEASQALGLTVRAPCDAYGVPR